MKIIVAIVLAAGRGQRAGAGIAKTYRPLAGKPVLRHSLQRFADHPLISHVQPVIHQDDSELFERASEGLTLLPPAYGGATRALSVAAGMKALAPLQPDAVLIHDGARPFLSDALITRLCEALDRYEAVIPALPVTDAIWRKSGDSLQEPVARHDLLRAQTPQGFHFARYAPVAGRDEAALDDAEIALSAGLRVGWVEGEAENHKLTFPEDFEGDCA